MKKMISEITGKPFVEIAEIKLYIELRDYKEALKGFNWYFEYLPKGPERKSLTSDYKGLRLKSKQGPEWLALYNQYKPNIRQE